MLFRSRTYIQNKICIIFVWGVDRQWTGVCRSTSSAGRSFCAGKCFTRGRSSKCLDMNAFHWAVSSLAFLSAASRPPSPLLQLSLSIHSTFRVLFLYFQLNRVQSVRIVLEPNPRAGASTPSARWTRTGGCPETSGWGTRSKHRF